MYVKFILDAGAGKCILRVYFLGRGFRPVCGGQGSGPEPRGSIGADFEQGGSGRLEQYAGKRGKRKLSIRGEIIKAAEDIFLEKGYRLASVDEIAARADVTKRTLYKYFPSKLALFIHMIDVRLRELEKDLSSSGTDIRQRVEALFNFTSRNDKFMSLYWMIDSEEFEGEIPVELVSRVNNLTNRMLNANESMIKDAIGAGTICDVNPVSLMHFLSAVNKGIFIHTNKEKRFDIAEINPRELFDLLLVILDRGIFKSSAAPGSEQ